MFNRYYKLLILFLLLPAVCFAGGMINSFWFNSDSISLDTSNALSTNMALCYVFKDGSGSTVTDLTSNNNTGTLNNATWDGTVTHGAVDLNQSSSYISTANQVLSSSYNQYSVMVFGRTPATLDSNGALFNHEYGANWRSELYLGSTGGISFSTRIDGSTTLDGVAGNTVLSSGTDFKLVITHDGTSTDTKKIYLDGTLDKTQTPTSHGAGNIANGDKTWLGYNSDGYNFTGKIYAVYVWTGRVLSQSDVTALQSDAYTMINGVSE